MPSIKNLQYISSADLPTEHAVFRVHVFIGSDGGEYLATTLGNLNCEQSAAVLTRVHSSCVTGDALGSLRCDCGAQLQRALELIAAQQRGILLYLPQEGRGIGLANKIKAYALQDQGEDTVSANLKQGLAADMRDYSACLPLLSHFGVHRLRLLTNNPRKVEGLKALGIDVVERLPLLTEPGQYNEKYLRTKREKLQHLL